MKQVLEYIISILFILLTFAVFILIMPEHWFTKEWFKGIRKVFK
ncbi:MAG: hypothetical protein WC365_09610 [Candidatus Babeliales bacterium]